MEIQKLDEFIESILDEKRITDIEPDVSSELVEDMKKRLLDQINKAAIMKLSEEKAAVTEPTAALKARYSEGWTRDCTAR